MNMLSPAGVAIAAAVLLAGCGEDRAIQPSAPAVNQPAVSQPAAAPAAAQVAAQEDKKDDAKPASDGKPEAEKPVGEEKKDGPAK